MASDHTVDIVEHGLRTPRNIWQVLFLYISLRISWVFYKIHINIINFTEPAISVCVCKSNVCHDSTGSTKNIRVSCWALLPLLITATEQQQSRPSLWRKQSCRHCDLLNSDCIYIDWWLTTIRRAALCWCFYDSLCLVNTKSGAQQKLKLVLCQDGVAGHTDTHTHTLLTCW